ncbi:MAG: hypothetical protein HY514_03885 [Candidatus Aenigmarchaeota archaeon]|nr:hypothetical protein [Candidatus Aenigmarchaeota archaeon]
MFYKKLTPERKKHIEETATSLRSKYATDSGIDFHALASELGINMIESSSTHWSYASGLHCYDSQDNPAGSIYLIELRRFLINPARERAAAHEFGHVVLGHLDHSEPEARKTRMSVKQAEANYFAYVLTGMEKVKFPLYIIQVLGITMDYAFSAFSHPIKTIKSRFFREDPLKVLEELDHFYLLEKPVSAEKPIQKTTIRVERSPA